MSGAIFLLPQYAFMVWCSVKKIGKTVIKADCNSEMEKWVAPLAGYSPTKFRPVVTHREVSASNLRGGTLLQLKIREGFLAYMSKCLDRFWVHTFSVFFKYYCNKDRTSKMN
jgi:hypothetical protein